MDKLEKMMSALGITRAEAEELIKFDKEVDKMSMKEVNADLTPEQKKVQKEMAGTGTKKKQTVYKFDTSKKVRKDAEKEQIVAEIFAEIQKIYENAEIVNANREISFKIGENSYSLTLTKHRK